MNDRANTASETDSPTIKRIGRLTYVLCYDRLTRDESFIVPAKLERNGLRISRAVDGDRPHYDERSNTLLLPDPYVSREGIKIAQIGGSDRIINRGAKHLPLVAGQEVYADAGLADGDLIEVGHSLLCYRLVDEQAWIQPDERLGPTKTLAPSTIALASAIRKVAPTDLPVLVLGESGAGKEIVVQDIRAASGRSEPYQALDCGALADMLGESDLFGHVRGAFTDARSDRPGCIRAASGGTLFLDEIGNLSFHLQAKLMRVLEDGHVRPLGSERTYPVQMRLISATNADLADGLRFRHDLLTRIAGVKLTIPPLRDRREDLGILAAHFLKGEAHHNAIIRKDAARKLFFGPLATNVRGLKNALRSSVTLGAGSIELRNLPPELVDWSFPERTHPNENAPENAEFDEVSTQPRRYQRRPPWAQIDAAVKAARGNLAEAARKLGVDPRVLSRWLKGR